MLVINYLYTLIGKGSDSGTHTDIIYILNIKGSPAVDVLLLSLEKPPAGFLAKECKTFSVPRIVLLLLIVLLCCGILRGLETSYALVYNGVSWANQEAEEEVLTITLLIYKT